jgi:hypothetical protein
MVEGYLPGTYKVHWPTQVVTGGYVYAGFYMWRRVGVKGKVTYQALEKVDGYTVKNYTGWVETTALMGIGARELKWGQCPYSPRELTTAHAIANPKYSGFVHTGPAGQWTSGPLLKKAWLWKELYW